MRPVFAFAIEDRPGAILHLGYREGVVRPAMWITSAEEGVAVLASFHGDKHLMAAVHFLQTMTHQVNRAIAHYKRPDA